MKMDMQLGEITAKAAFLSTLQCVTLQDSRCKLKIAIPQHDCPKNYGGAVMQQRASRSVCTCCNLRWACLGGRKS